MNDELLPQLWVKAYSKRNKKGKLYIVGNIEDCGIICEIFPGEEQERAKIYLTTPPV